MNNPYIIIDNYSIQYFIDMISAFINGNKLVAQQEVNWDDLRYLAGIHSLSGLLGYMSGQESSKYKPEDDLLSNLSHLYLLNLQNTLYRDSQFERLIAELVKNKVPHILMKGYVIKTLYPIQELRSMGDIDFVIHENTVEQANNVLINLGYTFDNISGFAHEYSNKYISAEMHTKLLSSTFLEKNSNLINYFEDCWDHVVAKSNCYSYELVKEYHLLYLLSHMAKHFRSGGCGIRMVMDIAIFLKHYENDIDFQYLWKELDKLELKQFSYTIFNLCKAWFHINLSENTSSLNADLFQELSHFVISKGTFGRENKNALAFSARMEYEKNTSKNKFLVRAGTFFKSVFPKTQILKHYYSKADKGPPFLIMSWFIRLYILMFKQSGYSKKIFSNIKNAKREADDTYNLLRNIGL